MSFIKAFVKSIKKIFKKKKSAPKKKVKGGRRVVRRKKAVTKRKRTIKRSVPQKKTVKKTVLKKKAIKKKPAKKKIVQKTSIVKKKKKRAGEQKVKKAKKSIKGKEKGIPQKSSNKQEKLREEGEFVGVITHYFSRIEVVVIKMLAGNIRIGDQILIKGNGDALNQKVVSLQIESVDVKIAKKGQLVGLKVLKKVQVGDRVFKL